MKKENRQALEKIVYAQHIEAIKALDDGIAHDLNNMIHCIMVNTRFAQENLSTDDKVQKYLGRVFKGAKRAAELVDQIQRLSNQHACHPCPVKIHTVVKEAIEFLKVAFPDSISIQDTIITRSATMVAPVNIHQVVMNLCINAYHSMLGQDGVLTLVLKDVQVPKEDNTSNGQLQPGEYIRLEVSDTGCGMDPETLKKIFIPHFTTKSKGTGLGLSIVQSIVERHRGMIRVSSKPGKGSSFRVYFPTSDNRS